MGRPAAASPRAALVERYAAVVCDLDGVVYRGPAAVDHAVDTLAALPVPVVFATNNASRTPEDVAAHLRELGVPATADSVVTSSQAGARVLAQRLPAGARVLAVGGPGVAVALEEQGHQTVSAATSRADAARRGGDPEPVAAVLQGYGPEVTAADLAEAAYAVQRGALWVATNGDATIPTDRGIAPGNGSLVAAVAAAVRTRPLVVGKPHAPLYLLCAERVHHEASRLLAVGDRLDTDVAGAVEAGMDSALVLTGVETVAGVAAAPAAMRPTYLLEDLRGLTEPYAAPLRDGQWWVCGGERGRLVAGEWQRDRAGHPTEAARALVAAVHDAMDAGDLDATAARALVSRTSAAAVP